jgi:hypothetical protein
MSFIPSRVLTNCQKWLTTCHIWLTTCLQTVKKWWLIDIQSILPIDHRKNQYNRTTIGQFIASDEFYLQRGHIDRQTNRRRRWSLYIIKKIYLFTINDSFYFLGEDVHTHSTNKQKQNIEPPPVAPRRQYTYTQTIHTDAQTGVSIFHVSIFWEREAN